MGIGSFIDSILRAASEQAKLTMNGIIRTNFGGTLPRFRNCGNLEIPLRPDESGFFGNHLAVFPDVDGSAVHAVLRAALAARRRARPAARVSGDGTIFLFCGFMAPAL